MNNPVSNHGNLTDSAAVSSLGGFQTSRRRFLGLATMAVGGALIGVGAAGCGTAQTGRQQEPGSEAGRAGVCG